MLVSLANQRLIRFRQRKRRKIGAYRRHLKSRPRSQPSSQRHHAIAMRLVLLGLAEVRISPADEHVLALDSRHDAYVILAAAPYRHLHSQLDSRLLLSALHPQKPLISSTKGASIHSQNGRSPAPVAAQPNHRTY